MNALAKYAKAIMGALVPGVCMFFSFNAAGPVTAEEWQEIVATMLAGLGIVWAVPNAPAGPAAPTPTGNGNANGDQPAVSAPVMERYPTAPKE